jgi:hypothetical protein
MQGIFNGHSLYVCPRPAPADQLFPSTQHDMQNPVSQHRLGPPRIDTLFRLICQAIDQPSGAAQGRSARIAKFAGQ